VVSSLRNKYLRDRHWIRLLDLTGLPFDRSTDQLYLNVLVEDYNVVRFKELVAMVSTEATQEVALELLLDKVHDKWKDIELTVNGYKDTKDAFILGDVEEVMLVLEDSMVLVATITSSRFVTGIKGEVERVEKQLRLFSDTLDEWLECQRQWLYLETIFAAPDIQRQLPAEARVFNSVDKQFKDIMRRTRDRPGALLAGTLPGLWETLHKCNMNLEMVQKNLEDYLEIKRVLFPRFYFLSNDELIEILSQTRNPQAVQPHLQKCFDGIRSLDFESQVDISAMVSGEGERIPFSKGVKARGSVEVWLGNVEAMMRTTVQTLAKRGVKDYPYSSTRPSAQWAQGSEQGGPIKRGGPSSLFANLSISGSFASRRSTNQAVGLEDGGRSDWVLRFPCAQLVLVISQVYWCLAVEERLTAASSTALAGNPGASAVAAGKSLSGLYIDLVRALEKMTEVVRGPLTPLLRKTVVALVTLDVHNRDIVDSLIEAKCCSKSDFAWQMQLRYEYEAESDLIVVRQVNARFDYGYEYLGAQPRLVVTPMTDRCYMTLTGALHLKLGGAPAGPAGTGKTETTKDLGKALGVQCVVFNCGENLDYK
jgi:dynein heavy chain